MNNKDKIILDLCGGTGAWSRPYKEAGYDVRLITLPNHDVRTYQPPSGVYGILAAPPCTHFSLSGAQYWKVKDADGRTYDDISILTACLMLIALVKPTFWALENPVGRMGKLLGRPQFTFNPCDFGDPYTKKTCLWLKHLPLLIPTKIMEIRNKNLTPSGQNKLGPSEDRWKRRSLTYQGIADAMASQWGNP